MFITVTHCSLQQRVKRVRISTATLEWMHGGGISPSVLRKGGLGRRCLFIIGVGARGFFGVRCIFAQISSNLPEKLFVQLLPTKFFPKKSWRTFLVWPPEKGLHVFFCKPWSPFLKSNKVECHFYTDFHGFCLDSQLIKILGVCLHLHLQQHCFS